MSNIIDKCPICGSELQATRELYLSDAKVNTDTGRIVTYEVYKPLNEDPPDADVCRIYCAEDHTYDEMMEATNDVRPKQPVSLPSLQRADDGEDPNCDCSGKRGS
jgi:hypothetical protein